MTAEDVPEDLLDLAWRAELARRVPDASAELIEEYCDAEEHPSVEGQRAELRPILAAVLPEIERLVRDKVADEIEARGDALRGDRDNPISRDEWACYGDAKQIARGGA